MNVLFRVHMHIDVHNIEGRCDSGVLDDVILPRSEIPKQM